MNELNKKKKEKLTRQLEIKVNIHDWRQQSQLKVGIDFTTNGSERGMSFF